MPLSLKFIIALLSLCLGLHQANAAEGCLVGSNLYTARTSSAIQVDLLSNGMNVFTAARKETVNNCYSGTTNGNCQVCHGTPAVGVSLLGIKILLCTDGLNLFAPVETGVYYSSFVVQCDLDDYTWAFGAAGAIFGMVIIRKKNTR